MKTEEKNKEGRILAVIAVSTLLLAFFGGCVSGYFYFRAEQRSINFARDAAITDIQRTLHALDERTKACLK